MQRTRHRAKTALRLEALEVRTLLNSDVMGASRLLDLRSLVVDRGSYDPTRILVRYKSEAVARGGAKLGLVSGLREVRLPAGANVTATLAAYREDHNVLFAEPDYVVSAAAVPNDPYFGHLWGLNNTGQSGGLAGSDIDAAEAWDIAAGAAGTVVAVIDSGVDYNHPDLAANIWTNPRELAGDGLDNDGNGYVDDLHGYDFANGDGDPMDDDGHGTHVAGTIAAVGNDGIGVAGVAWNGVRIMALKFLDATGSGYLSDAIAAINYAVANGASLSNNSWGGGGFSQALADAIRNARDLGHIFVAAAGNGGADGLGDNNDVTPSYPDGYDLDNIVSVAATDAADRLASFSNFGATSVDLAAPGVEILSTTPKDTYSFFSGTSMATPHVTGVLALVRGQNPTWSYRQVIDRVLSTVDPVAALEGKTATGGRLNAARALATAVDATGPRVVTSTPSGTVVGPVGSVRVVFDEAIDPATFTAADVAFSGPNGTVAVTGVQAVANTGNTRFDVTFAPQTAPGLYRLVLGPDVRDAAGKAMDQDRNGVNGDSGDQYAATFAITNAIGADAVYEARVAPYEAIDLVPGASGVTTLLSGGDDQVVGVSLGGTFNFYGATYTALYVSTNGLITFGSGNSSNGNTDLTSGSSQRSIAPLWDDWVSTRGNAMILARAEDLNGDGIRDRVVLEWNKVQGYYNSPSTVTFQVILQLNTGSSPGHITFNYPDLDAGNFRSHGGSATVGLKDSGTQGSRRLLVSSNNGASPYVGSGRAIRFTSKPAASGSTRATASGVPGTIGAAAATPERDPGSPRPDGTAVDAWLASPEAAGVASFWNNLATRLGIGRRRPGQLMWSS